MLIIYVIDTSSWIDIARKYHVDDPIWHKLQTLVDSKRIICPIEVFYELENKKTHSPYNWCKQNKQMFIESNKKMESFADDLARDNDEWSLQINAEPRVADPYIISLAKHYTDPQRKFDETVNIIVTEESPKSEIKIPQTAEKNDVKSINMYEFIEQEALES